MTFRNKNVLFPYFILFLLISIQNSFSQEKKQKSLVYALDIISKKHDVYFTYNPIRIKQKTVNPTSFLNLSLKQSLSLLKKTTPYDIEYLGNNYYVLFYPKMKPLKKM